MQQFHVMVYMRIILTTLAIITCLLGDNFVDLTQHPLLRALADNATHAAIGALTGIAYAVQFYDHTSHIFGWFLIFTCFAVSSLIDVDHFVAARSFYLEDATNLPGRPALHCSSLIVIMLIFYIATACLNYFKTSLLTGVVICAFITHHTRDAIRRGYWIYPFGHTERLPYVSYIVITVITPHIMVYLHGICRSALVQHYMPQFVKAEMTRPSTAGYRLLQV